MSNLYKSKLVYLVIFIIIVSTFAYFNYDSFINGPEVIIPGNYPVGTRISLYKDLPPDFPVELILENASLNYSGTVAVPGDKTKTTVSYVSSKSLKDLAVMYENVLKTNDWNISKKTVSQTIAVFLAGKTNQKIILTISSLKDKGVMVTFQYEK
ncbi:MAG: hypothetical protein A3H52_00250 [Candidatus Zambryskibacteria bacterium RIFCSPLOWO2_02_FULL_39_26]|uniref:Uncharacterized protein n=1 Tax=Candidatus Zambryskibacteria bacterium RIFCSPLOWO2_12_FULL_39_23 TaxID=1802776 RepID=A0A1G2URW2_9BACT|nr:MAG: hypothetical protein A3E59_02145 [Candidatus Zambryskibacteria bacterium RIFCSPHIGHO2_12_FULL_39_47]OHB09783.1 MAG: hypothetical protein A3H52_00250 [Candidatus Zambryskibacteria bacterium RIFCSPLOWO2_02_FULL_39_26]OHB12155.1 MAG: hypothetical protein A3G99_00780 [Candidatus Zambryskibacteria bacterium RIFCSPLOWO2_12_FULL_39_23]